MLRYLDIFTFSREGFLLKLFFFFWIAYTITMCSVQWHLGLEVCGLSWQYISKVCVYLTDSRWMQSWNVGHRTEREGEKKAVLHCTIRPSRHVTHFFPVALFELVTELWKHGTSLQGLRLTWELPAPPSSVLHCRVIMADAAVSESPDHPCLMLSPHTAAVNFDLMFLFSPDLQEVGISEDTTLQYFLRMK